jgi:hypothetical protein
MRPWRAATSSDECLDLPAVGDVGRDCLAGASFVVDDVAGLLGGGEVDVDGNHPGACAGERDRRRLAVAPAGTGGAGAEDEGDPVLQPPRRYLRRWRRLHGMHSQCPPSRCGSHSETCGT